MKRLLMVCALAGFAFACGDDDGDGGDKGTKNDGGLIDGSTPPPNDSGTLSVKVTNVGTACTTATASTACTGGSAAICQTSTLQSLPIPGGSCSAVCTKDVECGTGGNCPIGDAIATYGTLASGPLGTSTGYCTKSCVRGSTSCGAGFQCINLNDLARAQGRAPTMTDILEKAFCFPATPTADGGVGDAGAALTLDGGLDAGR